MIRWKAGPDAAMVTFMTHEQAEDDQAHDTLSCPEGESTVTRFSNEGQAKYDARIGLVTIHEDKYHCGHAKAWLEHMGG